MLQNTEGKAYPQGGGSTAALLYPVTGGDLSLGGGSSEDVLGISVQLLDHVNEVMRDSVVE